MPVVEPIEPDAVQAAAHDLLRVPTLSPGVKRLLAYLLAAGDAPPTIPQMAWALGCSDRSIAHWLTAAKQAGLLTVRREGRRNTYQVNHEALQQLAGGQANDYRPRPLGRV